jgi:hypothetical protein
MVLVLSVGRSIRMPLLGLGAQDPCVGIEADQERGDGI